MREVERERENIVYAPCNHCNLLYNDPPCPSHYAM